MLRRAAASALFCALALLACAARAEGCSCLMSGSACSAFGSASAVFVGTVTEIKTRPREANTPEADFWAPRTVTFVVEEAFSGVAGTVASVSTGVGGGDCGYNFEKGVSYLVFAHRGKEGERLYTGICTRTRPASGAAEDLEFLRAQARRPSGVTISGSVGRPLDRWDEGGRKFDPLEGVRVMVSGPAGQREVLTDARGRYELSGLPPGAYEVVPHLPDELIAVEPQQKFNIADRGCGVADFYVTDNGRIKGRVLDAEGRAVPKLTVTLLDAEGKKREFEYGRSAQTDAEGLYKFTGLPAGRYLLGVRTVPHTALDDPASAFPRTYYPGAAQASEAEVLELKTGEELTLRDLRLPPRLAESVVRVRVVWGDGTPVPNANVLFRETTYGDSRIDHGEAADAQGQFEIKTRVGAVFRLHATTLLPPAGAGTPARAEPQTVTVAGPVESVTLVITKLK
jgi:hypothetical protein